MKVSLTKPDLISKVVSLVAILIVVLMFTLAAYLNSFLKGKIDKNLFTVSQALAFGNKPAMIFMLTVGMSLLMYLNYHRGLKFLYIRLFLLFVVYALITSLFWVTTYYNRTDHFIIAFNIFTLILLYILFNSIALYNSNLPLYSRIFLILLPILGLLGFIGLIVGNIPAVSKKVVQLFPSFENYMLFITGLSNLALGFI